MKKLAINGGEKLFNESVKFRWPIITKELEDIIIQQLHTSISIYDNSGILKEFEDSFAKTHNMPFGLLVNSGTSGLQSAFYSIGIKPGDEIICPVYTFHATFSPAIQFGAIPVMVDCDKYGQISSEEILKRISNKTKAIVVTHMWGYAANIKNITKIAQKYKIPIIEDCSHAHGGEFTGKPLGSFGDISVWSLQGPKIITGGEGGICLFRNRNHFEKALIYGHYNKRPKQQITNENLRKFSLTGAGLKLRASTINTAMAKYFFDKLPQINHEKSQNAHKFEDEVKWINGIKPLKQQPNTKNSWYAQIIVIDEKVLAVSRQKLVEALHAEGLVEFDIPESTMPLNKELPFVNPAKLFPYLYDSEIKINNIDFPNARMFYNSIIKLPVWTFSDNQTQKYIDGLNKVLKNINELK